MLFDTSACVDYLRNNAPAVAFFKSVFARGEPMFLSAVTYGELFSGQDADDPRRLEQLESFVSFFRVLPVDSDIAKKAGDFRRTQGISLLDAFIAATATRNRLQLVSRDQKAFSKIKGLKLVKPY